MKTTKNPSRSLENLLDFLRFVLTIVLVTLFLFFLRSMY